MALVIGPLTSLAFPRIPHRKRKILQARLQQYVNRELPDVQAGFRKGNAKEKKNFFVVVLWKSVKLLAEFVKELKS